MCYLVEDRDNGETCFRCQKEVSHSLGLNTLRINRTKEHAGLTQGKVCIQYCLSSSPSLGFEDQMSSLPSLRSEDHMRYTNSPVVHPPIALLPGKPLVTVTPRN